MRTGTRSRWCSRPRRSSSAVPTTRPRRSPRRAAQFRQLGLGYANLGALLMALGHAYDSPEGRAWAAALTSLMTGHAYATVARTAARMGPFAGFADERGAHARTCSHAPRRALPDRQRRTSSPATSCAAGQQSWESAVRDGEEYGVRNSQATVLAPTGTIGLMMDCDTTGIEPDLGLVKVEEAGRWRHDVDRQPDDPAGAAPARLHAAAGRRDHRLHRRATRRSSGRRTWPPSTCRCSPARWATTRSTTRVTCG